MKTECFFIMISFIEQNKNVRGITGLEKEEKA